MIDCHVFLGSGAGPVTAGGRSGVAAPAEPASADPAGGRVVEADRLGDEGCRVCRTKEDRNHHGTVEREAFFANFSSYDAPFPTEVRLALANNWRKVRTRSDCCGNYGQPGC